MRAVTPLTSEQLAWRPAPNQSSVNELIAHITGARLWWFYKMSAPGSAALARQIAPWAGEKFNAGDNQRAKQMDGGQFAMGGDAENDPRLCAQVAGVELADDRTPPQHLDGGRSGTDLSAHQRGRDICGDTPMDHLAYHVPQPASRRAACTDAWSASH